MFWSCSLLSLSILFSLIQFWRLSREERDAIYTFNSLFIDTRLRGGRSSWSLVTFQFSFHWYNRHAQENLGGPDVCLSILFSLIQIRETLLTINELTFNSLFIDTDKVGPKGKLRVKCVAFNSLFIDTIIHSYLVWRQINEPFQFSFHWYLCWYVRKRIHYYEVVLSILFSLILLRRQKQSLDAIRNFQFSFHWYDTDPELYQAP